jgi:hypothetical protein
LVEKNISFVGWLLSFSFFFILELWKQRTFLAQNDPLSKGLYGLRVKRVLCNLDELWCVLLYVPAYLWIKVETSLHLSKEWGAKNSKPDLHYLKCIPKDRIGMKLLCWIKPQIYPLLSVARSISIYICLQNVRLPRYIS